LRLGLREATTEFEERAKFRRGLSTTSLLDLSFIAKLKYFRFKDTLSVPVVIVSVSRGSGKPSKRKTNKCTGTYPRPEVDPARTAEVDSLIRYMGRKTLRETRRRAEMFSAGGIIMSRSRPWASTALGLQKRAKGAQGCGARCANRIMHVSVTAR